MDVTIYLEPFNQTFRLHRDYILQYLPDSLFAQALEGDPEATEIKIPNPVETRAVMKFLVDYSQVKEPEKHLPDLLKASSYLNIPCMLYYTDPLYEDTPNK